jgi:uncharacterized Zn-finger protein
MSWDPSHFSLSTDASSISGIRTASRIPPTGTKGPGIPFKEQVFISVVQEEESEAQEETPEAPFKCDIHGCKSTCTRKADLRRHERSVHGDSVYACSYPNCSKSHSRLDKFKEHLEKSHGLSKKDMEHFPSEQWPQFLKSKASKVQESSRWRKLGFSGLKRTHGSHNDDDDNDGPLWD